MMLSVWTWLVDAIMWMLEGLFGMLQVGMHFHTDVPWYQVLASQLIVLAIALPLVFLGERAKAKRKEKERRRQNDGE